MAATRRGQRHSVGVQSGRRLLGSFSIEVDGACDKKPAGGSFTEFWVVDPENGDTMAGKSVIACAD